MIKIQNLLLETSYLSTEQKEQEQVHQNEKESDSNKNLQTIGFVNTNGNERAPIVTPTNCWTLRLRLRLEGILELPLRLLVKIGVVEFIINVLA